MKRIPVGKEAAISWQKSLSQAFRSVTDLLNFCQLPLDQLTVDFDPDFPIRVTRSFASMIEKGNPDDPLLRQVLPLKSERTVTEGYVQDPVGDLNSLKQPGVIQKYAGRCLLIATSACAIHCRYCFRRHFPYQEMSFPLESIQQHLQQHKDIQEVILSGGDPLLLADHKLEQLSQVFKSFTAVKTIRIHTRIPVVLAERIGEPLIHALRSSTKRLVMVVHINHANEMDASVTQACRQLAESGILLLNQSVLLKNVNDTLESQINLCEKLFQNGILPYYLHMLDSVQGASHFEVPENLALQLHQQLRQQLPGYLVPRLVREVAGEQAKTVLAG